MPAIVLFFKLINLEKQASKHEKGKLKSKNVKMAAARSFTRRQNVAVTSP